MNTFQRTGELADAIRSLAVIDADGLINTGGAKRLAEAMDGWTAEEVNARIDDAYYMLKCEGEVVSYHGKWYATDEFGVDHHGEYEQALHDEIASYNQNIWG